MQGWGDNMSKKIKKPISQLICESLDVPSGALGRTSFIEAVGNRELTVIGCEGLRTYTDSRVVLELCDGVFSVIGKELELKSFLDGTVTVRGIIASVHYGEIMPEGCDVH